MPPFERPVPAARDSSKELQKITPQEVDDAFENLSIGEIHAIPVERKAAFPSSETPEDLAKQALRRAAQAEDYERTNRLSRTSEVEDTLALAKLRGALGVSDLSKKTGKERVEFTPGAVSQFAALYEKTKREREAAARREQPPSQQAA